MEFSIIDIETTGLSTKTDRIVEICVLSIDEHGNLLDELNTLVSPERAMGATSIHGITSEMVSEAPTFKEIAPLLTSMLNNRLVIAHNAIFDIGFLNSELYRTIQFNQSLNALCTLQLSRKLLHNLPSFKLPIICEYFDIPIEEAHTARQDCFATMQLFLELKKIFEQNNSREAFKSKFYKPNRILPNFFIFQESNPRTREVPRSQAVIQIKKAEKRLYEMLRKLPDKITYPGIQIQEYVDILERALSDRIITTEESSVLLEIAIELGISKTQAIEIHQSYLSKLVRLYLLDGHISKNEMEDLEKVAGLLALDEKLDWIIHVEKTMLPTKIENKPIVNKGKSICITGELSAKINGQPVTREYAHELALSTGMSIKNNVSTKLDYLVIADPHTQSRKAVRAKELNIQLLSEAMFWHLIGVKVD